MYQFLRRAYLCPTTGPVAFTESHNFGMLARGHHQIPGQTLLGTHRGHVQDQYRLGKHCMTPQSAFDIEQFSRICPTTGSMLVQFAIKLPLMPLSALDRVNWIPTGSARQQSRQPHTDRAQPRTRPRRDVPVEQSVAGCGGGSAGPGHLDRKPIGSAHQSAHTVTVAPTIATIIVLPI